jgi:hypothetical protein
MTSSGAFMRASSFARLSHVEMDDVSDGVVDGILGD